MRSGYADQVYIVSSGENMSIYAAANIAAAIENFRGRGYAELGGIILNRRNVKNEDAKVQELCSDFHTGIVGAIDFSELVQEADDRRVTLMEAYPESAQADAYRVLAGKML